MKARLKRRKRKARLWRKQAVALLNQEDSGREHQLNWWNIWGRGLFQGTP